MEPLKCRCAVKAERVPGRPGLVTCPACGKFAQMAEGEVVEEAEAPVSVVLDPVTFREVSGPGSPGPDWPGVKGHDDAGPKVKRRGRGRS